jgi:hypothetical protein
LLKRSRVMSHTRLGIVQFQVASCQPTPSLTDTCHWPMYLLQLNRPMCKFRPCIRRPCARVRMILDLLLCRRGNSRPRSVTSVLGIGNSILKAMPLNKIPAMRVHVEARPRHLRGGCRSDEFEPLLQTRQVVSADSTGFCAAVAIRGNSILKVRSRRHGASPRHLRGGCRSDECEPLCPTRHIVSTVVPRIGRLMSSRTCTPR